MHQPFIIHPNQAPPLTPSPSNLSKPNIPFRTQPPNQTLQVPHQRASLVDKSIIPQLAERQKEASVGKHQIYLKETENINHFKSMD